MVKRMLIDATHAEETRVVVMNGTRLEEFDVETSTKKQLKGNIYLAKIVRVEPSLQAAFVDYGGNRHGFLAFSEIHPDYYQIPVADRQALLAEQREVMRHHSSSGSSEFEDGDEGEDAAKAAPAAVADGEDTTTEHDAGDREAGESDAAPVDHVGGDEVEEEERRRPRSSRNYKIQEVIKRRQIVLVQVVKEERGNKGAALTTFLSLAGRYCVLMPNTARGGGVSRKITNPQDRKRLKSITNEMDIPEGMAVIVRTAGSERTKPEIKRDYEYLLRLWDSVRELTLKSIAPALVYEEANLIKRSIRDLYSRDIEEIQVDGEEGYRLAKDFMRMLTPSHARRVQLFRDPVMPLFQRYQVEAQLDSMHSPVVQLKSGGYLVINQTEALVAIDVNSGRSTKERHIEETALKTNSEAADEVARQLRLRDLAGLIVIDFIDMEESRNNHSVERRLKEALRFDRARIQLGKISAFGLMEMSRQRLRPSLMETSFLPCPHCGGTGLIRSVESASMHILRAIEEEGIRRRSSEVTVTVHSSIAFYILNQKRKDLADIEARYGFLVFLTHDDSLIPPTFRMEKVRSETPIELPHDKPISADQPMPEEDPVEEEEPVVEAEEAPVVAEPEVKAPAAVEVAGEDSEGTRRRRRRRRRRGRREDGLPVGPNEGTIEGETPAAAAAADDNVVPAPVAAAAAIEVAVDTETESAVDDGADDEDDENGESGENGEAVVLVDGEPAPRRRRRGKRGGRRRHRRTEGLPELGAETDGENNGAVLTVEQTDAAVTGVAVDVTAPQADEVAAVAVEPIPADTSVVEELSASAAETVASEAAPVPATDAPTKPKRVRAPRKTAPAKTKAVAKKAAPAVAEPTAEPTTGEEAPAKPKRPRAPRKKAAAPAKAKAAPSIAEDAAPVPVAKEKPADVEEKHPVAAEPAAADQAAPSASRRKGWWNRFL
ncbi:ribonuclease E/G [Telmatospirillum sp.]|uniref:Rne/Rng family ribonuclease n=1 Tax=Telmatospirillum sp. TaxID=2079197 RepID=UPI002851D850|nr:ribonuclease E/G [Telmatospirillum sp.]MDR3439026.1 ribonuclease E/G [Telmatospirillum sp.]